MFRFHTEPKELDSAVRRKLLSSLQYILNTFGNSFKIDLEYCNKKLKKILTDKVSPRVFARYYDLVFSLNAKNVASAQQLILEIVDILSEDVQFKITPYSRKILGDDYERFPRLVFTGFSTENPMASPSQELYIGHKKKLEQAQAIISAVDNDLYIELKALLLEVIITVHNKEEPSSYPYGGASSFMTWGGVFINAEFYSSLHQVVLFYVHELTHCILFGHNCNEILVLNPLSESYPSPLRTDSRPMDGIYHATLVCARLVSFLRKWAVYGAEDKKHAEWLTQQQKKYLDSFFEGASIINKNAKLSKMGQSLFKEAEEELLKY